ncbi:MULTISPECIES: hypothetical protein [Aminiphilus]|jgi:hypothetical protein|uniref:hypothetical protein n=1 Tax=Aminiphilus TaxID=290731 RepID=UPI0012F8A62A|nr:MULTISPECIES: hypothetical protein [Aminiphilus]
MKPSYCINDGVSSCRECAFVNYGLDCMNQRVRDDEEEEIPECDCDESLIP